MIDHFRGIVLSQLGASLAMLDGCLLACPPGAWGEPVGRYPFWHVAYHTLCYVDVYLSKDDASWEPQSGPAGLHPLGRTELEEEFPSRRFERDELRGYVVLCGEKARAALSAETDTTLMGPSGFPRLGFSRAELHLYNLRHAQHHTGQLSAFLRRLGVETRWVKAG